MCKTLQRNHMRIGFDLDNTIICYDQAIKRLAEETLSIPDTLVRTKASLRDYLRAQDREDEWTEFQGRLYGPGMDYAEPFPSAIETINAIQQAGHTTFIISHRTRRPYLGPQYDLHESAKAWIGSNLTLDGEALINSSHIYLNETRDEKIGLVDSLGCDVFIDDLIEVLNDAAFPPKAQKLLFKPQATSDDSKIADDLTIVSNWTELAWLTHRST